jgi:hypothetical protein
MLSLKTTDSLTKLAKIMATDTRDNTFSSFSFPFRSGIIPKDIKFDRITGDSLHIWGETYFQYDLCLQLLTKENILKNSAKNEIENMLWHFACEFFANPQIYDDPKNVRKMILSFQKLEQKRLIDFEVLILIENFVINGSSFDFAGVKFITITPNIANDWGLKKDKSFHKPFYEDAVNKTGIILFEYGTDAEEAFEKAHIKLISTLNMLRAALLFVHEPRVIGWRIHDEQMLFPQSNTHFVRRKGDSGNVLGTWQRGFSSMTMTISDDIKKQIEMSHQLLSVLFNEKSISKDIRIRFIRALEWIGNSITRESADDKVIELCTALETILTKREDPKKGECIALRATILNLKLSKSSFNPKYILEQYSKRSDIVHGSAKNICSDSDAQIGRSIVLDVIIKSLSYIQINKISRHSTFLLSLQDDEILINTAVNYWRNQPKYYKDILKARDIMLKQ